MLIKVNGEVLVVKFRYGAEEVRKLNGHKNRNAGRRYTLCEVDLYRTIDKWTDSKKKVHTTKIHFYDPVASGKATCSLKDRFDKRIGRAVSFSRAIESSHNEFIKNNLDTLVEEYCKIEKISSINEPISAEPPTIKFIGITGCMHPVEKESTCSCGCEGKTVKKASVVVPLKLDLGANVNNEALAIPTPTENSGSTKRISSQDFGKVHVDVIIKQ